VIGLQDDLIGVKEPIGVNLKRAKPVGKLAVLREDRAGRFVEQFSIAAGRGRQAAEGHIDRRPFAFAGQDIKVRRRLAHDELEVRGDGSANSDGQS